MSESKETTQTTMLHLRSGSAAKLGQHASGMVHYDLLTDQHGQELYIKLTNNDGGGYFSRECVPFARVRALVADIEDGQSVPSKFFQSCFAGRSSNNAGFLACVLRAEGLVCAEPTKAHLHQLSHNWADWEKDCLAMPGRIMDAEVPDTQPAPTPVSKKEARARRKAERASADATEEVGDADPA